MAKCPHCNENHPDELVLCPTTGKAIANLMAPDDPLVGTVLEGKYKIESKLGEGGMGAVYLGEHVMMKRRVAIKTLLSRFTTNQNAVQRFQREAQAASAIGHPNIVTIHDLGQTPEGLLYIVMELLEGQDLAHELRAIRDNPGTPFLMPPVRVLTIARQASDGLAAAHEKGVVHRDLKPDNIFLSPARDGGERVKLLDFGISKIRTPGGEEARLTTDGSLLGTPFYMSPEQAQGKSDIDHRADIYAFGVILYELFTGRVPFEDSNMLRVIAMHALEQPAAPRQVNPALPQEVESLILKAMAKEPVMRYQTMTEMRDAIEGMSNVIDTSATSAGYLAAPSSSAVPGGSGVGSVAATGAATALPPGSFGAPPSSPGIQPTSVVGGYSPTAPSQPGFAASSVSGPGASGVGHVTATPMAWDEGSAQPGRGMGLKIALVVIIVLLLGGVAAGVGFLVMNGGDDEDPVAEIPQTHPQQGPVVQPPPLQYPTPTPPVATNPNPVPVPIPPTTPPNTQEVVPPVPQKVTIRFDSEPSGARVYQGDTKLGVTPHELLADHSTEEQHFTLKLRGYRDHEIAVVPDQDRSLSKATLRRARRRPTRPTGGNDPNSPGGLFKANPFGNR